MTIDKSDPEKTIAGETFSEPYRAGPEVITNPVIVFVTTPFHMAPPTTFI
jgi:hypothetical protein